MTGNYVPEAFTATKPSGRTAWPALAGGESLSASASLVWPEAAAILFGVADDRPINDRDVTPAAVNGTGGGPGHHHTHAAPDGDDCQHLFTVSPGRAAKAIPPDPGAGIEVGAGPRQGQAVLIAKLKHNGRLAETGDEPKQRPVWGVGNCVTKLMDHAAGFGRRHPHY